MTEPAVELRDIFCVHRSDHGDAAALQGLTLTVAAGERVCVVGPSGAGKTTLLRVVAGLQRPSAGVARVFGRDVGRLSSAATARERNRWVGFLHQHAEAALPPDLTVARAVALPLALRGGRRAECRARAAELLAAAGLADRSRARPGQLSGGERQRVAVCAAIAHRPRLLLADEPTAELDEPAAEAIAELIDQLADSGGITVITVSHDAALAARAPRAVHIRDGRVVEDRDGSAAALVVGPGGWVRLGRRRLLDAGIGARARAKVSGQSVVLSPAPEPPSVPTIPSPKSAEGAPSAHPALVQLRAVTQARGHGAARRTVLDGLTLDFRPGSLTMVVGRSGAGKSTLLELLACLAAADAGELRLDGEPVGRPGAERLAALRRGRIGYLAQEPVPVGFLSAIENVALALTARGHSHQEAADAGRAVLDEVGLAERTGQRVSRLSAGEAQRVGLARALACANGLLVVDEPTSRLDDEHAGMIARLLVRTAHDRGHTVICATHDLELIRHADDVVTLDGARGPRAADSSSTITSWP